MILEKKDIIEGFNFRHACKEFDADRKISKDDFHFILETGRLSPSSFGFEPWKFLVVQDVNFREKLKEFSWGAQKQLPSASHFVVLLTRKAVDTKAGSDYLLDIMKDVQKLPDDVVQMKSQFFSDFQNNDFDLTDERKLFDWACKQTYIALGNMMTSAALIGIDSCPIEGFDREKIDDLLIKENLIDGDHFSVAAMVAFGYRVPNGNVPTKTRNPIGTVVEWIE